MAQSKSGGRRRSASAEPPARPKRDRRRYPTPEDFTHTEGWQTEMRAIGLRVRQCRLDYAAYLNQNVSQRDMARYVTDEVTRRGWWSPTGRRAIDQALWSRFETGREEPSPLELRVISAFGGRPVAWALTGEEPQPYGVTLAPRPARPMPDGFPAPVPLVPATPAARSAVQAAGRRPPAKKTGNGRRGSA